MQLNCAQAQVIPWAVSDSNWVMGGSVRLEPSRTVFVGALHGMLTAPALATIMNDLFSGVVYAGNSSVLFAFYSALPPLLTGF